MVNETLILFADAPKHIPGRPHLSQIYRWSLRGIRGIRLEFVQIGGRRYTSREALDRFFSRLTAAAGGAPPSAPPIPTPRQRRRAHERACAELRAEGFRF